MKLYVIYDYYFTQKLHQDFLVAKIKRIEMQISGNADVIKSKNVSVRLTRAFGASGTWFLIFTGGIEVFFHKEITALSNRHGKILTKNLQDFFTSRKEPCRVLKVLAVS